LPGNARVASRHLATLVASASSKGDGAEGEDRKDAAAFSKGEG